MATNIEFFDKFCCFTGLHSSQLHSRCSYGDLRSHGQQLRIPRRSLLLHRVMTYFIIVQWQVAAMVIEKPWPDCGCPLSINFKPANYDRVPFPHSCGISKDEYHRHYICDHEVYLTLSVSEINTTTGQWVAKRLKEGRLFVIRGPPRPKPKKKVPAWKVHLRSLSGKRNFTHNLRGVPWAEFFKIKNIDTTGFKALSLTILLA